jgi:hypothetical protein
VGKATGQGDDVDYRWRCQDTAGQDLPADRTHFDSQSDAEEWLSATWSDLRDAGVDQVTLMNGETEIYGPMSLHPA